MPGGAPVTILTSAVGLGIYLPALLIERQLRERGLDATVEVLEDYFTPDRARSHLAHKAAHHSSFALAQLAHRMARDVDDCLDAPRVEALLAGWEREGRRDFIVWSGFWKTALDQYRARISPLSLDVDLCRIDAEVSASFKVHRPPLEGNEIWLWNGAQQRLEYRLSVTDAPPLPFAERDHCLLAHGGGWGIGTYEARAAELAGSGFSIERVVHALSEANDRRPKDRCWMVDPAWHPWVRSPEGRHGFPPMAEVGGATPPTWPEWSNHHALYDVVRRSKAIVSKPGGGTLIDSLSAATPVVLLEPYGYTEKSNGLIWEHLGFGISYATWKAEGFSAARLEALHANLLAAREGGTDYPRSYAERLLRARQAVA